MMTGLMPLRRSADRLSLPALAMGIGVYALLAMPLTVIAEATDSRNFVDMSIEELMNESITSVAKKEQNLSATVRAETSSAVEDTRALADLSIEELLEYKVDNVYGASKFEQKITQAPASISIITADEIKNFGYRTLAELLRGVRGLYGTYDRNYSNFGIRGFARPGDFDTRVLLLLDGHRMNDNLYDSALIGTEFILDIDLVERVEVIRGPSSSIYGNNAFFGVINVITKRGKQIDGAELATAGGRWDRYTGRLSYGKEFTNGLELVLSGSVFDADGQDRLYYREFNNAANNYGIAEDSDGEYSPGFFSRLAYRDLSLSTGYSRRDKHIPTASFGTVFNDGREKTIDERIYTDLKYEHAFSDDLRLMGKVYYDRYAYNANYPYNFAGPGAPPFIVLTHDDNYGDGVGAEMQINTTLFDRHTVIVGGEYRDDLNLFQSNFTRHPKTYSFRDRRDRQSGGVFTQGEFVLRSNLLLNAGLRYDEYSNFGGTVNPRLGLMYNPWADTTFKLLYGQAYRAPNAYELYQAMPGFSKAAPNLDPETIRTYEMVYEQGLPLDLRLSVVGYYYDIEDLLSQRVDPADGLLVFRNLSSVTAKGVEVEVEGRYARGLLVRASYALQQAEDEQTGSGLNNSPRHLPKLNLAMPVYGENLYAGLELQYTSRLKTLAGNRTPGFPIVNATVYHRRLTENLEFSATVYNLFDKRYAYPGSTAHFQDAIPQDGRGFNIKLTCHF